MKISNHLLVAEGAETPIPFQRSPHQSTPLQPVYLVMHYTGGGTLDGAVSWFLDPKSEASAHFVIGRDGRIVQMVALNRKAWHAGESHWGNLVGMNRYSIGIELVNAGQVRRKPDGRWRNNLKVEVPEDEVTLAKHKAESAETGWQEYSEAQLVAALEVARVLNAAYHFTDVIGHEDVAPGRKIDPGPLFPMSSFRSRVLGRA